MISSINIQNFKSIKNSEAKFPEFCAVVGLNAAGKTNLFHAVGFAKALATTENTTSALNKITLLSREILYLSHPSNEISFQIELNNQDINYFTLEFKLTTVTDPLGLASFVINYEKLTKLNEQKLSEIIYIRDSINLKDKDNKIIPLKIDPDRLALSIYKNNDASIVRDIFSKCNIIDLDKVNLRDSIARPGDESLASLLIRFKRKDERSYNKFQDIVRKILPSFSSIVNYLGPQTATKPDKDQPYMLLLEERGLNGELSMMTTSSGDLRTLYILALAMSAEEGSTVFIEEIENGMHPKRSIDLVEHLEAISSKKNIQLVFSTHSANIINKLRPSDILLVSKDSINGTRFISLKDHAVSAKIGKILEEGGEISEIIYSNI